MMMGKNDFREILDGTASLAAHCAGPRAGYNYSSVHDFVLDRGREPNHTGPIDLEQFNYLTDVAARTGLQFVAKQCFHNAALLAMLDTESRIKYIEGFAYTGSMPVHHAWNELDGHLIDLTRWAHNWIQPIGYKDRMPNLRNRVLGTYPEGWIYLGVQFDTQVIRDYVEKHAETSSMLDNWRDNHPLFRVSRKTPRDLDKFKKLMKGTDQ